VFERFDIGGDEVRRFQVVVLPIVSEDFVTRANGKIEEVARMRDECWNGKDEGGCEGVPRRNTVISGMNDIHGDQLLTERFAGAEKEGD